MKVVVHIIESEAGWGQRVDETKTFRSRKAARQFIEAYNKVNDKPNTPSWYMYAKVVEIDGVPAYGCL